MGSIDGRSDTMRGFRLASALIVGVVFVAAACSSSSSSSSSTVPAASSAATTTSAAPAGGGGGSSTAKITVADFAFDPSSVDVSSGKVTITVTNNDTTTHTFTLDDGSSDTQLPAGSTQTIDLNLAQTVGWHCSIHPSMTGTLNVS
jgi:plastocyanin